MRLAPRIDLTAVERDQLEKLSRGRSQPQRLVERAQIILLAFEGKQNREIAEILGVTRRTVGRWRSRFAAQGMAGIEKDAPRPGRRRSLSEDLVEEVVRKTTQDKPAKATHWSTRSMAKAAGVSASTIRRIWHRHGLKPHLTRTFKLSNDPDFAAKLEDVIGLYLNPPEHALVFSVDEKSQIHVHFTPTSASWLNMVERFFRDLTHNQLRRGSFDSIEELISAIEEYLVQHNADPTPFIWTKSARDILEKVTRARQSLNKSTSV